MLNTALFPNRVEATRSQVAAFARHYWLWVVTPLVGCVVLFASPGGYGEASRTFLHGLCAQTPSHTIRMGEAPLPFDARMTGIYGGFLIMFLTTVGRGRVWWYGGLTLRIMLFVVALVAVMAIDGFNSLLTDLGVWHPYGPSNWLRVVTGYAAGVALAVGLGWLLASSTWHVGTPCPPVTRMSDFKIPALGLAGYGAILWLGTGWLHLPVTVVLVLSAWLVVSILALVIVLLVFRLDDGVRSVRQLHVPGTIAALLALSIMIGLAGARFWAERTFGISNAMM